MRTRNVARVLLAISVSLLSTSSEADAPNAAEVRAAVGRFGLPLLLTSIANQEAQNLPRRANAHTEIVTVQHTAQGSEHRMNYVMRVLTVDVRTATKAKIEEARRISKKLDANELCYSPLHGTLIKEYAVIYRYAYHDADMRFIHAYDVDKATCVVADMK